MLFAKGPPASLGSFSANLPNPTELKSYIITQ
jgi:hypothetical protein